MAAQCESMSVKTGSYHFTKVTFIRACLKAFFYPRRRLFRVLPGLIALFFIQRAAAADTVWVQDAVPAGAWTGADGGDSWNWVGVNPPPVSGALAHQTALAPGIHYHYFSGATETLTIDSGDTLTAHVFLDPSNPPREIMLGWFDGASCASRVLGRKPDPVGHERHGQSMVNLFWSPARVSNAVRCLRH